nr:MAG TPA: hypothetical protein [Caudoviricetes sp.]
MINIFNGLFAAFFCFLVIRMSWINLHKVIICFSCN